MPTPTLNQFIQELAPILRNKDGLKLRTYLILEPPLPTLYTVLIGELRQRYPEYNPLDMLESQCKERLPEDDEGDEGGAWTAFITFLVQYFTFLRDVNVDQLVETYDKLRSLLKYTKVKSSFSVGDHANIKHSQAILALSDGSMGIIMLPTVISYSRILARLAIGLDKRPDLIAHLTRQESAAGGEDVAEKITLVESSANVVREAFKKCLSEKSAHASGVDADGKPEGRRIGIYLCANICFKLFFRCRKLRSAEQILQNIYQLSPPLKHFPASQRVTFLYYLGRYQFANNHFFRAQTALQAAYDQCHIKCIKQRRRILIYLITSNIILGRFPSSKLLQREEAVGLGEHFLPLCQAIKRGDLTTFRQYLDLDNEAAEWFLQQRILLQLRNRCEVLVWRSLARKTFILSGFKGDMTKKAPSLELTDLLYLATLLERRYLQLGDTPSEEEEEYGPCDPDLDDEVDNDGPQLPEVEELESIISSMICQDLLHGYLSHKYLRFIITGAKIRSALEIGFPNVWDTVCSKVDNEVPGWVQDENSGAGRNLGKGIVVNLTGVQPVGDTLA